jgi:hypothetical protein
VAGAAVGVIQAIFSWNSAEKKDKAAAEQAKHEFETKLMNWTFQRNRRIADGLVKQNQYILQSRSQAKEEAKSERLSKQRNTEQSIEDRRRLLWDSLTNAGSIKSSRQKQLASTWS